MTRRISVCLYCGAEVETTPCPCNPGFVPVTVRVELVPASVSLGVTRPPVLGTREDWERLGLVPP